MKACDQLRTAREEDETLRFSYKVYCQSYSTSVDRMRDCFIMALPMKLYRHFEDVSNDGLVSENSAKFENYKGRCLDIPVSHSQIVDFMAKKSQREKYTNSIKKYVRSLPKWAFKP
jgi:hypothetical protein